MTTRTTWKRRLLAVAALGAVGLAATPVPAAATTGAVAPTDASAANLLPPSVTSTVPVGYSCYVTFPGGSTTVPFSLTFTASAPQKVAPYRPFAVTLDPQEWTPDPKFNQQVRTVKVRYKLPDNAWYVWHTLSGGKNLTTPPQAQYDWSTRVLTITETGPLPASVPFDLPTVTVYLLSGPSGTAQTTTGGTSLTDPSWTWVRTDLEGVERPFDCNPAAPVVFTSTTIG
ncbi:hypothetical protein [Micromonospora maritima]|uniref:Dehydratase n=1 Tax=Micromonospora maritima TaxID=986711 RepID=A0ABW7ZIV3_9ACTN